MHVVTYVYLNVKFKLLVHRTCRSDVGKGLCYDWGLVQYTYYCNASNNAQPRTTSVHTFFALRLKGVNVGENHLYGLPEERRTRRFYPCP